MRDEKSPNTSPYRAFAMFDIRAYYDFGGELSRLYGVWFVALLSVHIAL